MSQLVDHHPIITLLEKISSKQIQDLIDEVNLTEQGYAFFYALDNHDIGRFCFPGGISGNNFEYTKDKKEINYELITDIITAHDDFFNSISPTNPVFLLAEYTPELLGLRNQIIGLLKETTSFNYADSFNEYLDKHFEKNTNINYDFTLFISIATGLLNTGIKRFNQLIRNEDFYLHELEFAKNEFTSWYLPVFEKSFEEDYIVYDEIFRIISSLRDPRREFSSKVDSEVITRLIKINILLNTKTSSKKLILYLSSVDSSTNLFQQIEKFLPKIEDKPFRFHRTVEQLFLSFLLKDLSLKVKLERFEPAYRLALYREINSERFKSELISEDKEYLKLEKKVIESFQDAWEKYINANLSRPEQFKKISDLRRQLDTLNDKVRISNLKKLYSNLQQRMEELSPEDNLQYIGNLEETFEITQILAITFRTAYRKLNRGESIEISRGNDKIAGTGQHLPIVFLFDDKPFSILFDKIAELYLNEFAIRSIIVNSDGDVTLNKDIQRLAKKLIVDNFESFSLQERLVICLYLLVLPDAKVIPNKTNDEHVEEFLLSVLSKEFPSENKNLHADYLYAVSWIMRRNNNPDALGYAQEGIRLYPDDGRFYHSRFLINVCQLPENLTEAELLSNYISHLSDIHKAQEKYPSILSKKSQTIATNINLTLLNSEIYCSTLILSLERSNTIDRKEQFEKLRNEKLIKLKQTAGDNYNNYPEFLHTEAFLELYESELETDRDQKRKKLESAIATVSKGIDRAKILARFSTKSFEDLRIQLRNKLNIS